MARTTLNLLIRHVTKGMAAQALDDLTDKQLLCRFIADFNEVAFEALVRRHGLMVLRVCSRTLRHSHDAEDAFQATFLLLASKANSIRKAGSLASWLHGVAHRVSLKARAQMALRQRHEKLAGQCHDPKADQLTWGEVKSALDEELDRLPEKWRLPLILCCLEEKTQDEAARALGWSKNTVRRRLDEARAALGRRFVRRGLALSATLCATALRDSAVAAAVPAGLVASTVEASALVAAGQAAAGIVSANVMSLVKGVLNTMCASKLKVLAAIVLLCGLMSGAWELVAHGLAADQPPAISDSDIPVKVASAAATPDRSQPREKTLPPGSMASRLKPHRDIYLKMGGGTRESEAAVASGLVWLARQQEADGHWKLDGNFPDQGAPNDVGGTALALLPFLGAGHTHKSDKDNPHAVTVSKGIQFMLGRQDRQTGAFPGNMYTHAIGTIVLAESFALTNDPKLKQPAQQAVTFIVHAQHAAGGWRYAPGQAGDTCVTGWQVTALHTARNAGLVVPDAVLRKAETYLDRCCGPSEGYGYLGPTPTPTITAIGLLCRQNVQSWGRENPRLMKGVANYLRPNPAGAMRNIYYDYHATQVMHHLGGEDWKAWDNKMRPHLIATQDKSQSPLHGSWSSAGDTLSASGGRLLMTSLSLLTLEVYYRYVPLSAGGKEER